MTAQELLDELKASMGNRTDLTDARYLLWLNWAMLDVCGMHRKRLFRPQRFHVLEQIATFSLPVIERDASAGGDTTITLSGDTEDDDYYNDMIIKITDYDETSAGTDTPDDLLDQVRLIKDFDGTSHQVTVTEEWDENPDEYTSCEIYPTVVSISSDIGIDPNDTIWAIQELEYAEDGGKLSQDDWGKLINRDVTILDEPKKFSRYGDTIIFDTVHDDDYLMRMYYYRYPTLFVAGSLDDECELPVDWHEIVFLGAVYRGFSKLMEPDRASVAKEIYVDAATNRTNEYAFEAGHIVRGIKVRKQ